MNRRLRRLDGPQPDCPYALLRVAALPRLRRGARAARSGRDGARFTHSCCHAKSGLQEWGDTANTRWAFLNVSDRPSPVIQLSPKRPLVVHEKLEATSPHARSRTFRLPFNRSFSSYGSGAVLLRDFHKWPLSTIVGTCYARDRGTTTSMRRTLGHSQGSVAKATRSQR